RYTLFAVAGLLSVCACTVGLQAHEPASRFHRVSISGSCLSPLHVRAAATVLHRLDDPAVHSWVTCVLERTSEESCDLVRSRSVHNHCARVCAGELLHDQGQIVCESKT